MKDKIVSADDVEKFLKRHSHSMTQRGETAFLFAFTLYHFGVRKVIMNYSFWNGDENVRNVKLDTTSFSCYGNITVKRKDRLDQPLVWFLSDYFKMRHCGCAGEGYMQMGLCGGGSIPDRPSQENIRGCQRFVNSIINNFNAIKDFTNYKKRGKR